MKGTLATGQGPLRSEQSSADKLYGTEPDARGPRSRTDPTAATADKLYPREDPLAPPIQQALNNRNDDLAIVLGWDESQRKGLGRDVESALIEVGLGPYDYRIGETLIDGVVSAELAAERGQEFDETRDAEFGQDARRELHATYGENVTKNQLERVKRVLKGTKLATLISRARAGNNARLVRGLVEWVRNEDLGK